MICTVTTSTYSSWKSLKTEADPTRVENACAYVENLYRDLKLHGNHLGRDRLLTILILGIADDLLQLKQQGRRGNAPERSGAAYRETRHAAGITDFHHGTSVFRRLG